MTKSKELESSKANKKGIRLEESAGPKKKKKKIEKIHEIDSEQLNSDEEKVEEFNKEDPFICHFCRTFPKDKKSDLEDPSNWKANIVSWTHLGRLVVNLPILDVSISKKEKLLLDDEDGDSDLPIIGAMPPPPSPKAYDAIINGFVVKKLVNNINSNTFSAHQSEIFTILSNYLDFWHTEATHEKWDKFRRVYAIHCLNHILKIQGQILKNNKILKGFEKVDEVPPRLEDQGFTRPKILILLPFKNSAYKLIKIMISLLGMEVMNKKKFEDDFGPPEEEDEKEKPEDFYKIFAGDINDDFKIGITLSKKALKLYSKFTKSDIIIASPLGLRRSMELRNDDEKDLLSSIEIFIMDQADIMLMQNWDHITLIEEALNKWPKEFEGLNFDIYRIYRWHFEKLARHYRQTIIFSSTTSDFIRGVMSRAKNFAGSIELMNIQQGVLSNIKVHSDLTLLCVKKNNPEITDSDAVFSFFTKELLPRLRKKNLSHTLIYIPDYFDYVRLNNFFQKDGGTSFATINEYMIEENSKVAKARSLFFEGKKQFLLYTERFHFNRRYKIKGIRHIIFYTPPTYPHFFQEICDFLSEEYQNRREEFSGISSVYFLYQITDKGKLNDLIGTNKTLEILRSGKNYHSYLTGVDV